VLIILDLSKSFKQYCACRLDGDIAESVLPYADVQKTFDDPTGINTITNNEKYLGTNRFFSHYFLHKTFRRIPFLLQNFYDPIASVYYTAAIAKLIMQIAITIRSVRKILTIRYLQLILNGFISETSCSLWLRVKKKSC
jgi:hypothetical protein